MLGTSRKRFIGEVLGLPEAKERIIGTVATSVMGALHDVDIVRVHDVREDVEAVRLTRAVYPERERGPLADVIGGRRQRGDPHRLT